MRVGGVGLLVWLLPLPLWSAVPDAALEQSPVTVEKRAVPTPRQVENLPQPAVGQPAHSVQAPLEIKPLAAVAPPPKPLVALPPSSKPTAGVASAIPVRPPLPHANDLQKQAVTSNSRATPMPKRRQSWLKLPVEQRFKKRFEALLKPKLPTELFEDNFWAEDDFLASYVAWELLFHPDYHATVPRLQAFLQKWPEHPMADRVEALMDQRMVGHKDDQTVLAWFAKRTIKSVKTSQRLRYLEALLHEKMTEQAYPVWRQLYREGANLEIKGANAESWRFNKRLQQSDHEARARALIQKKQVKEFDRLLADFPKEQANYFRALASATYGRSDFDKRYGVLDAKQKVDADLWEARINGLWRLRHYTDAIQLLMGVEWAYLGDQQRRLMRYKFGKELLYSRDEVAQAHRLLQANAASGAEGLDDSTWMAGWSALKLGKQGVALEDFRRLGRYAKDRDRASQGAYWSAKLLESEGKPYKKWLQRAAKHPDTFYGLLAIERLQGELTPAAIGGRALACDDLPFTDTRLAEARQRMAKLVEMDRAYYVGGEVQRAARKLKLNALQQICLAEAYQDPYYVLRTASALRNQGGGRLWRGLYPEPSGWEPSTGWSLHPAAVWGTVRQESLFNHRIQSSAGAMGMMQLMPATARGEARILNLPRATSLKLLRPEYNLSLGQSYLQRMLNNHEGDMTLALISYNAGPNRANLWKVNRDKMDDLTFIENIPFSETRHYVKRVTHGQAIYLLRYQGKASLKAWIQPHGPGLERLQPPKNWQGVKSRLVEAEGALQATARRPPPRAVLQSFYDPMGQTEERFQ
ncbi:Lytic transglycosylase, catalytic [Magnetococcus marinus MC-1]|uniref:Lytic transglycosylase, catalytic n=2 Tax=Magnetococcus TaxID=162171 RepID=A0L5A2_MAGMM|nr:Lytic transglycosylase, catalytic [Magnetococcus marinus MC-1]